MPDKLRHSHQFHLLFDSKPSHQNSETVISIKRCAACGATDNVFVKKFPAILCSDCGLLYIRFISKNIMPPCAGKYISFLEYSTNP